LRALTMAWVIRGRVIRGWIAGLTFLCAATVPAAAAEDQPAPIVLAQASRTMGYAPVPSPFDFLSAIFGGHPRRAAPPPVSFSPPAQRAARSEAPKPSGVAIAYCVRTCDGSYFPLQGRPASAADSAAASQCAAFCPAAKTQVFVSPDRDKGIDAAADRSGKAYSEIPNAYVYRSRLVPGCSCTGKAEPGGLAPIHPAHDPTLQRGDAVMTADGMRIFTGGRKGPPFRSADFVSPRRFPELPRDMRRRLDELTVATAL